MPARVLGSTLAVAEGTHGCPYVRLGVSFLTVVFGGMAIWVHRVKSSQSE